MAKYILFLWVLPFLWGTNLSEPKVGYPNYWDSTRVYTYSAVFMDSIGDTLSDEIIKITPTGKSWKLDPKQTLLDIDLDFSAEDSAKLALYPANNIKRPWFRHYSEGAIEDSTRVWMHPVRANQYIITELAPFPEVRFPIEVNQTWSTGLTIYESFGSFEGHIDKFYKVTKMDTRKYDFGTISCWEITADAIHNKLGTSTNTYYFNEEYGFTEMNYRFYNGKRLFIKLTDLKK